MIEFGIRNITLFFKDRSAVALSFLAELIVLGLYSLFMRDDLIGAFPEIPQADVMMDVWMMAGVLGITPITTAMGAYGVMVEDKAKKIDRDFATWPVSRWRLLGGYLLSAVMTAMLMSLLCLIIFECYFFQRYELWAGGKSLLYIYGLLVINAFADAAMVMLLVAFIRTGTALAACCTIIGALLGFLTGIYLPIGSLPEHVQWMVKGFPVSHGVVLMRQTLMGELISENLGGAQSPQAHAFMEYMGIRLQLNDSFLTESMSILYLMICGMVCIAFTGLRFSMRKG